MAPLLCLSQASIWIPNVRCSSLFCVQMVVRRKDGFSFCWHWWKCCPPLFKLSFHNTYSSISIAWKWHHNNKYLVQLQIIKQLIFYVLFCCVRDNLSTLNALKLNLEFNPIILLRYQLSGAVFILTCTIFSSTTLNAEYQLNLNMCFNRIVLTCGGKKYKKFVVTVTN